MSDDSEDDKKPAKKKVLDLLDDAPKGVKKSPPPEPVPAPPEEEASAAPEKEVLDLIIDDDKPKRTAKERAAAQNQGTAEDLPPISLIQAEKGGGVTIPVAAGAGAGGEDDSEPSEEDGGEDGDEDANVIHLKPPIMVEELAAKMSLKPFMLIKDLMEFGVFASAKGSIEPDIATQVCEKHGFIFEREKREKGAGVHKVEEVIEEPPAPEPLDEEVVDEMPSRPPIITFMGHVDHGKTSLLDAIRKSKIADVEAGGITQHIGASQVEHEGHVITFLDTPGHAAFSQMRARGADVTDIVVLVVAANDGIMPQTVEALNHARAAGVTIIVAINKIDLPGADVNRVKGQLQENDLQSVDWGGDIECVEVSATEGLGIDDLLETMLAQAEILELKASPDGPARAIVIESQIAAGRGPTASAIVTSGTLKVGTPFICGQHAGKVKSMVLGLGDKTKAAGPGCPVEILGFSGVPSVGDEVVEMKTEREAKKLAGERSEELRTEKLGARQRASLETFMADLKEVGRKQLKIVLKTDVQGTCEAITNELEQIESEKVTLAILHSGAGAITESDILLASASDAIIVGFQVKLEANAVSVAKREGVQVKLYSVIYELFDQVRDTMLGLLDPETREKIIGHAEVKEVFKLSRGGRVAGCLVAGGRIDRKAYARVLRNDVPVYDGPFSTLRRFQDDVTEVRKGLECGIRLGRFTEYEVGDIIQCYELENLELTL